MESMPREITRRNVIKKLNPIFLLMRIKELYHTRFFSSRLSFGLIIQVHICIGRQHLLDLSRRQDDKIAVYYAVRHFMGKDVCAYSPLGCIDGICLVNIKRRGC